MLSVRLNDPDPRPTKLTVRTSECRERECERHPRARRSGGRDWRIGTRLTTLIVIAVPGLRSSSDVLRDGEF
jgi:hypothetical protein